MAKSKYSQTWSSMLKYIKRELGTGIQLLEMEDQEIIDGLTEDCLSLFSQYSPHKAYCFINETNRILNHNPGDPRYRYLLPVDPDISIIDILEVMPNTGGNAFSELGVLDDIEISNADSMIDIVIANSYSDAAYSLGVRNTWEFRQPRTLIMDQELTRAAVIYNVPHETPKTCRPDLYNTTFKPLCLGHVEKWISAKRSKFENVSTPFGQINLNWQKLETDSQTHIQDAMQKLELVPPDKLIEVG